MLQKIIVSAIFSLLVLCSTAQKGTSYFIHKVRSGESFRSIAAKYNLTAQKLADYNNLDFYEGRLTAKTLRIPKKAIKNDSIIKVPVITGDTTIKVATQSPPITTSDADTLATSPAPVNDTQASTPPIVVIDTASQEVNSEIEQPTLKSDVSEHLPLIVFLGVSVLLLAAAIVYYRAVHRK